MMIIVAQIRCYDFSNRAKEKNKTKPNLWLLLHHSNEDS